MSSGWRRSLHYGQAESDERMRTMSMPQVVSREQWLAARKELLAREKELTRPPPGSGTR